MIYIHVPFCRTRCTYCGFYSEAMPACGEKEERKIEEYSRNLCSEISERKAEFAGKPNTLYIGGGTPSVLPLSVLSDVCRALEDAGSGGPYEEFTIEVNPEDILERGVEYVKGLKDLGVNRISMGVQSFDSGLLTWMNRRHNADGAIEAFRILRDGGIGNISIDLIFGIPQMDDATWKDTLGKAIALLPEHISAYQLSVEDGSALGKLESLGRFQQAGDEQCRRQYVAMCECLHSAGYGHYEVSNFALPGKEARHNSAYWARVPYAGLGPGAHSFGTDSNGEWRRWNTGSGQEGERLTAENARVEKIMLSLRTSRGIEAEWLRENCDSAALDRLLAEGALAECDGGRIRIPEERFFVSDAIIRELI